MAVPDPLSISALRLPGGDCIEVQWRLVSNAMRYTVQVQPFQYDTCGAMAGLVDERSSLITVGPSSNSTIVCGLSHDNHYISVTATADKELYESHAHVTSSELLINQGTKVANLFSIFFNPS